MVSPKAIYMQVALNSLNRLYLFTKVTTIEKEVMNLKESKAKGSILERFEERKGK